MSRAFGLFPCEKLQTKRKRETYGFSLPEIVKKHAPCAENRAVGECERARPLAHLAAKPFGFHCRLTKWCGCGNTSTPSSATAYWGWKGDTADGVANISARSVLVSPLFPNGGGTVEVPLDGIGEVWLCGRVVWQDGILIQARVARLYEARTP